MVSAAQQGAHPQDRRRKTEKVAIGIPPQALQCVYVRSRKNLAHSTARFAILGSGDLVGRAPQVPRCPDFDYRERVTRSVCLRLEVRFRCG